MSVSAVLASFTVGIIEAEMVFRLFLGKWFHDQCAQARNFLPVFLQTKGDEARQALILRAGLVTIKFGLLMLCALAMMSIIAYSVPWWFAWTASSNLLYLLLLSIVASVWLVLRLHLNANHFKGDYNVLDRCLHWLALELKLVREISFDLERLFFLRQKSLSLSNGKEQLAPSVGSVYVCGLARSGTTLMLHLLEDIEVFRSLTYRDMPAVLAPNLWKTLTGAMRAHSGAKERAHQDGVMVGLDSPESFEEVFWQTYTSYQKTNQCLTIDSPSRSVLAKFADYRSIVANPTLFSGKGLPRRYLSKNNNNIVRLSALGIDPTANILLMYRDPVDTALSLYQQHHIFSAMHQEDAFSKHYMAWLGHHEFGSEHLPFAFALPEMDSSLKPDNQNYWLSYWNAVYQYVLAHSTYKFYLIHYDALCHQPALMLQSIFTEIGVEADAKLLAEKVKLPRPASEKEGQFDSELLRRAKITYSALMSSSKNIAVTALEAKV